MWRYPHFELELKPKSWDIKSYTRQYKLPENEASEAHRQIEELHARGLIAESEDCTHNSAVFMVRKKDGTMRLVCDLRRINQLLKPFVIQLSKIDELLNEIASQRPQMLTNLDLYKLYYSVRLSPKTSNLTAFCSPKMGQSFCWRVLPTGLCVSWSVHSRR